MHNHYKAVFFIIVSAILLFGCAVAPIQREIELLSQDIAQPVSDTSKVRLVLFNNSNRFLYGMDGSGKINVSLDGKGLCRLSIGEYVIVETLPGKHTIDLEHRDMALFKSSCTISADEKINYVQVFATPASNVAEITAKPESFKKSYSAIKF